ncbi:hydrogenase assembly protein HypC [Clostridia bacterium]|nr:hydrogenase assembly protein HypC [Clostridia bacterium]
MCVAIPMEVKSIEGDTARVALKGNEITVNVSLIAPKVGDFVLIHAGCALEILSADIAEETSKLHDELEALGALR